MTLTSVLIDYDRFVTKSLMVTAASIMVADT